MTAAFHYDGPAQLLELDGDREVTPIGGRVYSLPEDDPATARLVAAGRLTIRAPTAGAPADSAIRPQAPRPQTTIPSGHAAARPMLAEVVRALRDGVRQPDTAAEAQAQAAGKASEARSDAAPAKRTANKGDK